MDFGATSFSINLFSALENDSSFQYHHAAPALAAALNGTKTIDIDTVYRLGSITKLLTVWLFLIEADDVYFSQPITQYVPELLTAAELDSANATGGGDDINYVRWSDVTIGELASHMAGLEKEGLCQDPEGCDAGAYFVISVTFGDLGDQPQPWTALGLPPLSMVDMPICSATLSEALCGRGDLGDEGPAGGVYSSTRDLSQMGRAILNSALLSPAQTRRWLKPVAHTASTTTSVGAPWEIQRIKGNHVTDLYTKSGNVGLYATQLVLSPDYAFGFTVMAAGHNTIPIVQLLSDMLVGHFLPAATNIAAQQARRAFVGKYSAPTQGINSSIILGNDGSPGLRIERWVNNGTDLLKGIFATYNSIRLYPTGATAQSPSTSAGGSFTDKMAYRAVYESPPAMDNNTFADKCTGWEEFVEEIYGGISANEFVFHLDASGGVTQGKPQLCAMSATKEEMRQEPAMSGLQTKRSRVHICLSSSTTTRASRQISQPPPGHILKTLNDESTADMADRYALSKLLVLLGVRQLAEKLSRGSKEGQASVIVNCVSPGWCKTELFRTNDGGLGGRVGLALVGRTAEEGSRTLVHAAVAGKTSHGKYLSEGRVKPESSFVRSDVGSLVEKRVWAELVDILESIQAGVTAV
ncbi:hypothetical protein MMC13_003894 [Lambiella insularis]|nr:hypothetical protein [Lambiella insularis]